MGLNPLSAACRHLQCTNVLALSDSVIICYAIFSSLLFHTEKISEPAIGRKPQTLLRRKGCEKLKPNALGILPFIGMTTTPLRCCIATTYFTLGSMSAFFGQTPENVLPTPLAEIHAVPKSKTRPE